MNQILRLFSNGAHSTPPGRDQAPIREELFGLERLEEHGASLAAAQSVQPRLSSGRPLTGRLAENGRALFAAYSAIARAIDAGGAITPAAEWLVDNYHFIERQIRQIRSDLPPGYYRQLPKLADGPFAGYPRVFGIAWAFVAHTDSRFDRELLTRFLAAYQRVQPLTIGELWAVSITLRVVLIENLRRLAGQIVSARADRREADRLADRLLGVNGCSVEAAGAVFARHETRVLSDALAVQIVHRLRDEDPSITPALDWLNRKLAAQGTDAETVVRHVQRSQGGANVTVRNIFTSLKLITEVDWQEVFEGVSLVDDILATGCDFRSMDFSTRNLYRSAIEELARGSAGTELEVAEAAVGAARAAPAAGQDARQGDPGFHLVAAGRPALERAIGYRPPLWRIGGHIRRHVGINGYAAAIVATTWLLLVAPLALLAAGGAAQAMILLLGLLGLVPAIDAAVALVNRVVHAGFGAMPLPALELKDGIPADMSTLIAVPVLLTGAEAIEEQIARLEIHHLASPGGELHFAIVSDWADAATETAEDDDALLAQATAGIAALNARHEPLPGGDRFLLLHRRRLWNPGEGRWMGWERKRGKLHELNRLLRGATDTSFIGANGQAPAVPEGVRFVVTLDADTRLPRDAVRRLIGKMAHPLNRARFDATSRRVVEGYGVLQPRVTPSLPIGGEGSLFQRTFSSLSGIDPYGSAVSDLYQDMSGDGSYAGKGIYEVDAFEASLAGRIPDGTILSHDLFEGIFARAGLASDIEVVEEFPARYDSDAMRRHRWARGDWQLLPWLIGVASPPPAAGAAVAAIPAIGRWKMVDNLRRTLTAPLAVAALVAGWTLPTPAAAIWTAFILATIVLPNLIPALAAAIPRHGGIELGSHARGFLGDLRLALAQSALTVTFLAHESVLMADAILRTLWRLMVSRRHLLEWVPAAQAAWSRQPDLRGYVRRMSGAIAVGLAVLALAALGWIEAWPLAVAFAVPWLASPAVALAISVAPKLAGQPEVTPADRASLRLVARRTWRYFETFVTATENWLPPDNFQEDPQPVVAHRTSPTNIGLYLLAVASARDFGWIGTSDAATRIEATLDTIERMERFRGHLFNWYDTRDLRPLDPRYVSTVDSGNLAGHLIALANAARDWAAAPPPLAAGLGGLADTLELAREEAARTGDGRGTQTVTPRQFHDLVSGLIADARGEAPDGIDAAARLAAFAARLDVAVDVAAALALEGGNGAGADMLFFARAGLDCVASHRRDLGPATQDGSIGERLAAIETRARAAAVAMDFGFLVDRERMLLSIGYSVPDGGLDPSRYDLLASEARLASFFAIAKGDVPARHWFRLGRAVTPVRRGAALISWSGSMFEYLMPSLVMRAPAGSLLEQTNRLVVRRQIDHAATLDLPWGISESAYAARNIEQTYQYSNFGVPGLGLKRGLGENQVVTPYATALAAMVDPRAASANLARLADIGALGRHGYFEALDYTASRLPAGANVAIVRAFMAHHQGMSIVAIADTLLSGVMRSRFHAEPMIQATELLLQERTPREITIVRPWQTEARSTAHVRDLDPAGVRRFTTAQQPVPATHVLSNGRLSTMLTAAGSGYTRWGDFALTRWREDPTLDDHGSFIYIRDVRSGDVWSAGVQPCGVEPESYDVSFHEDRAEFVRRDGGLETMLDVIVSSEDDAEVRRVSIANFGKRSRDLEITSFVELALAPQSADVAHPAFAKLFVQTERRGDALLAHRRRRAPDEPEIHAAHFAVADIETVGRAEFETDRARFLGRGRGCRAPVAVREGRRLSGTVGTVLDPIFAIRRHIRIAPGATVRIAFWTLVASSREALLDGVDRHSDPTAFTRAATLAWTQAQVELYHLGITAGDAALFQRLAGHVVNPTGVFRPSSDIIARGAGAQSGLWSQSLSGDLPIVLLRIADIETIEVARELLKAREYWRMKQIALDLVILNERHASYVQELQGALETLVRTSLSHPSAGRDNVKGGVFVLRSDLAPPGTGALLAAAARIVIVAQRGTLAEQLQRSTEAAAPAPRTAATLVSVADPPPPPPRLEFHNGLGGFGDGGRSYVTVLGPGQSTPAPWINVVANGEFGFHAAVEGSGYTWSLNSRERKLTPWSNDPVSDRPGEAFYLRDDDTGALWTPTATPIRDESGGYVATHGMGFSRFEHSANGVAASLTQFVPSSGAVKISRLSLRNLTGRPRRISVTTYVEWVLGAARSATAPFLVTNMDAEADAMFARNPWSTDFPGRVAFLALRDPARDWTGDRAEFLGRNGSLAAPAALVAGARLSRRTGAGLDPCGAMRQRIVLQPSESAEVVAFLGDASSEAEARAVIARFRAADLDATLAEVAKGWERTLGAVQVRTPDRAMDIMLNGWLMYQTVACRVLARSGFYQSSGAYGFRDQLQDHMALAAVTPEATRAHLLRAAGRQFVEGDVQHWWLPHSGQGVRTRISDDRPWLAYVAAHYVATSGDAAVLDEVVPFLEGQRLVPGEHEAFFPPTPADVSASLFEHCALALDASLAMGRHGLPLIGTGDWNDGMNRVGERGEGESVWLGWFVHAALTAFAPLATAREQHERAERWRLAAQQLAAGLEREGWDGEWYRRGYYDDGTPLGAAASEECRIDAIAQSWAVLSGAAEPARARRAMAAMEQALVKPDAGVALLFTPPFDRTALDPGYIKAYPPGLRENGGQYTHAALWSVMAMTALGQGDKAHALFAMLNPINHARTRAEVLRYKVEPYVVAADVYSVAPHEGRGGWTWYTGSAAWMQRAGVERILGVTMTGDTMNIDPCIPASWPSYAMTVRRGAASYDIVVENPAGANRGIAFAEIDGVTVEARPLRFAAPDDGKPHKVRVRLG